MSYSKNIYLLAQSKIEKRRKDAEEALEMRRADAYIKIPKLTEIQNQIDAMEEEIMEAMEVWEELSSQLEALQ